MQNKKVIYITISGIAFLLLIGAILFYTKNNTKDTTATPDGMQKEISLQEVAKHVTATDCWVYIGGQVFDASNVITTNNKHKELLASVCGGNGSAVYTVQKYSEQSLSQAEIVALRDSLSAYQLGLLSP